jgi:hypothetical protein
MGETSKKGKWSPSERKKRAEKCKNPKGFTMKQFCKNLKSKSKKGERNNNISSPSVKKRESPKKKETTSRKKRESLQKKEFLFNKDDPKKSFDVYIDKNPNDTIPVKYKTLSDVKSTIRKLEKLYKEGKYPHKRIKQVASIVETRLRFIDGKEKQHKLMSRYHDFLRDRTKEKGEAARKKMRFPINQN